MKLKYLFDWMQVLWTKLEIPWLKREIHYLDVALEHDIQMLEIIHQHEIEAVTREINRKRDIAIGKLARAAALTKEFSPTEPAPESRIDFSAGRVRG